jgi:hypothetical protein
MEGTMRLLRVFVSVAVIFGASCAVSAEPAAKPPLYTGLGNFGRKITTSSPEAQRYFDQGLCFLYAFNHDEAIRSFEYAANVDPLCRSTTRRP